MPQDEMDSLVDDMFMEQETEAVELTEEEQQELFEEIDPRNCESQVECRGGSCMLTNTGA